MRRAEPILRFDIEVDKGKYDLLKKVVSLGKSDNELDKELHARYVGYYMNEVRKTMLDSEDNYLVEVVDNYMSFYLKENYTVGIIVYDAVKSDSEAQVKVHKEVIDNGRFRPYILVEDN